MENKKETAVDWLFSQLPEHLRLSRDGFDMLQQAKELEKEQIMDAFDCKGVDSDLLVRMSFIENTRVAEQYYKETYTEKP